MRTNAVARFGALLGALIRAPAKRSAAFEDFRFSFFQDRDSPRNGLALVALRSLSGRDRKLAETLLINALPDARALIGLGALASTRAQRRLAAIFERERLAAQAAMVAGDTEWDGAVLLLAAQALWRIAPHPCYARTLIGRLRHAANWTERADAAAALAEIPTAEVDAALDEAMEDADPLVRHHAARALLAIHGLDLGPRGVNHGVYRVMAAQAKRRASGRRDIVAALQGHPLLEIPQGAQRPRGQDCPGAVI